MHVILGTVIILSFLTHMSWQTVQIQIKLHLEEQSDQGLHCLLFNLHCLMKYPKFWPLCLNFWKITAVFWRPKISEIYGIFHFVLAGIILVPIVLVPGHCLFFTFLEMHNTEQTKLFNSSTVLA